jgi:hypothetical protein
LLCIVSNSQLFQLIYDKIYLYQSWLTISLHLTSQVQHISFYHKFFKHLLDILTDDCDLYVTKLNIKIVDKIFRSRFEFLMKSLYKLCHHFKRSKLLNLVK